MPFHFKKEGNDFSLAVWKMDEQPEELLELANLSETDLNKYHSFSHEPRKKEWVCVRLLLRRLKHDLSIAYDAAGKPHFENSPSFLSISHTKNFAGLVVSD